jgi:hypothetical protein
MPRDEMSVIQPFQQCGFSHHRFDNTQLKITKHDRERDLPYGAYFKYTRINAAGYSTAVEASSFR